VRPGGFEGAGGELEFVFAAMPSIEETISRLKSVITDPNCSQMNRSTVKGYLGELLVKAKLEEEGLAVTHLGNQSGFDLECRGLKRPLKIDVKYSEPKHDFEKGVTNWGWALQHEHKRKPISCTHFVCLAVDHELERLAYYVVNRQCLEHFGRPFSGRFKKVNHGLAAFEEPPVGNSKATTLTAWTEFEKQIAKGWLRKIERSQSLSEVLAG
jgi:hypothetical protein